MLYRKFLFSICVSLLFTVSAKDSFSANGESLKDEKIKVNSETETQKALEKAKTEDFERKISVRGSLFEALESALKKNKEILSAQNELMAAHENHVTVASAFKPKVSLNTKYQYDAKKGLSRYDSSDRRSINRAGQPIDGTGTIKQGYDNSIRSYGVEIRQNLFHGFADMAALQETDLGIKAKWYSYEAKRQEILRNIAIVYFALLAKRDEINHLKSLLEARQNSREVAEWMYKTGAVKYLDVSQAIASVSETESKLAKAAAQYISYCAQFEELAGYKVPQVLTTPAKIFDEKITEKQAIEIAKKNNPQIIAASYALLAAKAAVKKPNPEFVPSVEVSYSYDHSYNASDNTRNHQGDKYREKGSTFALQMTVPIYDGGSARAEKRKYIDLATKAAVDKEKLIDDIKTRITAVWAAMAAAKQSLLSARKAVEARQIALHDAEEEYKSGVKIIKDVLDAQEKLFEAKYMETNAENSYFSSQCQARALIGQMTPGHLKIKDSDFSYKKHFSDTKYRF